MPHSRDRLEARPQAPVSLYGHHPVDGTGTADQTSKSATLKTTLKGQQ